MLMLKPSTMGSGENELNFAQKLSIKVLSRKKLTTKLLKSIKTKSILYHAQSLFKRPTHERESTTTRNFKINYLVSFV